MPLYPQLYRPEAITIPILTQLLDTYTDEQYKEILKQIPKAWQETNGKGDIVTKC